MADFTVETKRVEAGKSLTTMFTQATNAINQLKNIKINIVALKTAVQNDDDYTAEDEAAVQTIINTLLADIDTI